VIFDIEVLRCRYRGPKKELQRLNIRMIISKEKSYREISD
jgi:hypothetical protein